MAPPQHELGTVEVAGDQLGGPDVARVEALEEPQVDLLDEAPGIRRRATRQLELTAHRLEEREDLERLGPEGRVRVVGREELLDESDALQGRHRPPAGGPQPTCHRVAEQRVVPRRERDLERAGKVVLPLARTTELELARADLGVHRHESRELL